MSEIEEYDRMWRFKGIAFSKDIYPDKEDVLTFAKLKGWIQDEKPEWGSRHDQVVEKHKAKKKGWSGLRKKSKKRKKEDASSS